MLRYLLFFSLIAGEGMIFNSMSLSISLPFIQWSAMGSKFLFRGKHLKPATSDSSYDGSETSTVHSADTVMTEPSYNWTASDSKNTTKSKTHCCFKKFLHKFVGKFFPGVNIGVSGKLLKSHLKYLKRRGKASRNLTRTYLSEYFDTNFTESNNQTLEEQHFKYKSQNSKCIWKKFKCYVKNVFTKVHGRVTRTGRKKYFNATRDISFWLFTSENPYELDFLYLGNASSIFNSHFSPKKPTKLLIHGWKNSGNSTFCRIVRHAYVDHLDVNVIVVDWQRLSLNHYHAAYKHMHLVGKTVAKFLDFLWTIVPRESVHVIGHSLGAHVAGIAGHYVKTGRIHRITGLDPAGPMMRKKPHKHRLDKSDAEFVDVIHTCGHYLGFHEPLGHADFYPNRGRPVQPGCGIDLFSKCSHRRSYHLFMESIYTNSRFWGVKCASWDRYEQKKCSFQIERMGEHINRSAFGKFYLRTKDTPPFGLGDPLEETENYFRSLIEQKTNEDVISKFKDKFEKKIKRIDVSKYTI